ncbi:MAG: GNAT family N-acetyltransferase [Cytophagales bacterium]|nr:GNAT family N-acetyltransferase [Cytophagales bacterium]
MADIVYSIENELDTDEFIAILSTSTLAERRPVQDRNAISNMLTHANLIVTARTIEGQLVGVARSFTDFSFCTYLSDLAVDGRYQKLGIGKELIRITKINAMPTTLILLAAPKAVDYYPKIGMQHHGHCYVISPGENI